MTGGGEDWINAPWDMFMGWILMGLGILGAGGFCADGGSQIDGGWG